MLTTFYSLPCLFFMETLRETYCCYLGFSSDRTEEVQ